MSILKKSDIDTNVRPQDDFFDYVNKKWLEKNPIPNDEVSWGSFYILRTEGHKKLRKIVEEVATKKSAPKGSALQLVRDYWLSGMNMKLRNKLGFSPVQPYVEKIEAIKTKKDLLHCLAELHMDGFNAAWSVGIGPDDKKSDYNILYIGQGGTSLPDRDYYLKKGEEYESVRHAYLEFMSDMLQLYGFDKQMAKRQANTIFSFEKKLARAHMTPVEMRNPHSQYNPHSVVALCKRSPNINWRTYLKLTGAPMQRVVVTQPKFIDLLDKMFEASSINIWKIYLTWKIISGSAGILSDKAGDLSFSFYNKKLYGMEKQRPLWRRIIALVDAGVGEALGQLYVKRYFPPKAKKSIDSLVLNVMKATKIHIENVDWMSSSTKKKALKKLSAIKPKIGYPNKWESYKGLQIEPDDLFGNIRRTCRYEHKRAMKKVGKRIDKEEWFTTPSTVNAFFHPNHNEIVFPAGILQPPMFDVDAPDSINYGAIGSIIGHEITHAFDDEGRKFDEKGNLKDWWSKEDALRFEKRAKVLERQFSAFELFPGFKVNGKLTLGENIADLGGVLIGYDAWQLSRKGKGEKVLAGLTPEQQYFAGYAVAECGQMREAAQKKMLIIDPHSPSRCRVNGILSNVDAFYNVFGVQKGDNLYIPPNKRARIW